MLKAMHLFTIVIIGPINLMGDRSSVRSVDNSKLKRLLFGDLSLLRVIRSTILVTFLVYVGVFVYARFFGNRIIFQSPPSSYRDTNEIVKLKSGDAQISAIYLTNPQ